MKPNTERTTEHPYRGVFVFVREHPPNNVRECSLFAKNVRSYRTITPLIGCPEVPSIPHGHTYAHGMASSAQIDGRNVATPRPKPWRFSHPGSRVGGLCA